MRGLLLRLALGFANFVRTLQRVILIRFGFKRVWVTTPTGRVHALVRDGAGGGPTWVFVHGLSSQSGDWAPMLVLMRKHCARMIALDMPGHGESDRPSASDQGEAIIAGAEQALLSLLRPGERCVMVGNSLGGLAALSFTHNHLERVAGLVLISPAGAPMTPSELHTTLAHFDVATFGRALAFVDRIFVKPTAARPIIATALWGQLNRPYFMGLIASLREHGSPPPFAIAKLPPTFLMWGDRDDLLPVSSRDWYVRTLPAATTQVVQPAGFSHTPFAERAPEVVKMILGWAEAQKGLTVRPAPATMPLRPGASPT